MVEFCRLSLPAQKYKHYHQHSRSSEIKAPNLCVATLAF